MRNRVRWAILVSSIEEVRDERPGADAGPGPLTGDVMWTVPTLVTLSPLGTPIAHIATHVTAVVHSYHTDLFLPPHTPAK